MINITDFKQLGIILPNTNKALEKVLSQATHQELESLTQGKDLKSVLNSLLKQSAASPESNKELLQLVKENPTLKNLGDVSTTIKDLLNSLKSDKNPTQLEKVLQNFFNDIKDLKNTELKEKFQNSGVFLESKLKDVQNPQVELKNTLTQFVKNLQNSNAPASRILSNEAKMILSSEPLKSLGNTSNEGIKSANDNPKVLQQLSSSVEKLLNNIKTTLAKADTLYQAQTSKILSQLEHKIEPKLLTQENFKLEPIKEQLQLLNTQISKSFSVESKSLLDSLQKIFQVLNKPTLENFIEKDVPKMIQKLSDEIKNAVQKAEPIFQKETTQIVSKLELLATPTKLHPNNGVKEILSNDLKAVLLQSSEEIVKSNHPNQTDISKNLEKLSLQIDNYQLLSHLSNGTSLYLPYSWDMMEDGKIEMKKSDDETFYCDIYLKLKEYGEINLKLVLYEKNQLNLHIYSSNEAFKNLVLENIPSLRAALIDTQITPREIRVHEPKAATTSPYKQQGNNPYNQEIHMGFEVKG